MKFEVDFKVPTEKKIRKLINNEKVVDNIDEAIWFLVSPTYNLSWIV